MSDNFKVWQIMYFRQDDQYEEWESYGEFYRDEQKAKDRVAALNNMELRFLNSSRKSRYDASLKRHLEAVALRDAGLRQQQQVPKHPGEFVRITELGKGDPQYKYEEVEFDD